MPEMTIRELMPRIPEFFVPDRAAGINAVTQFHLTGEGGGDWIVTIRDQKCTVEEGVTENPNLTFTAAAEDTQAILSGKMDPMKAFMRGRLHLAGGMGLAMKLTKLFSIS